MKKRLDLVVVDDDYNYAKFLSKNIKNELKIGVRFVCRVEEALKVILSENPRVALVDIVFENDPRFPTGLHIVEKLSSVVDTYFVILTGSDSIEQVFRAGQMAVKSLVRKSSDNTALIHKVRELVEKSRKKDSLRQGGSLPCFVGISEKAQKIKKQIETAGRSDLPVLITGETGVGKDVAARLIHLTGERKEKPFIVFDAGSVEPSLVSKELFGNVKSAFTGAETASKGIFLEADKGTLFIDEIGDMTLEIQKYLLRALNKPQKIRPVGASSEIGVDVRIILATNRDIKQCARDGLFRNDLYARIDNPLRINIPPLRQRREDIPALMDYFIEQREQMGKKTAVFTKEAINFLIGVYEWPMNVREVDQFIGGIGDKFSGRKEIELDTVMENLQILKEEQFPAGKAVKKQLELSSFDPGLTLKEAKNEIEKKVLLHHLKINSEKPGLTAKSMGVSRTHLFRLMKKYLCAEALEENNNSDE